MSGFSCANDENAHPELQGGGVELMQWIEGQNHTLSATSHGDDNKTGYFIDLGEYTQSEEPCVDCYEEE